jgi:putative endonuclease
MKTSYLYIISNKNRTVFYTGVTADLTERMIRHRAGKGSQFCARYNVNTLVWYETHTDIKDAIRRETQIKRWNRQWKIDMIRSKNPEMKDLLEKRGRDEPDGFPLAWE